MGDNADEATGTTDAALVARIAAASPADGPDLGTLLTEAFAVAGVSPRGALLAVGVALEDLLSYHCSRWGMTSSISERRIAGMRNWLVKEMKEKAKIPVEDLKALESNITAIASARNAAAHGARGKLEYRYQPTYTQVRMCVEQLEVIQRALDDLARFAPSKEEIAQQMEPLEANVVSRCSVFGPWTAFGSADEEFTVEAVEDTAGGSQLVSCRWSDGRQLAAVDIPEFVMHLEAAVDGRLLAAVTSGSIYLVDVARDGGLARWDVDLSSALLTTGGTVAALAYRAGDRYGDRPDRATLLVWDGDARATVWAVTVARGGRPSRDVVTADDAAMIAGLEALHLPVQRLLAPTAGRAERSPERSNDAAISGGRLLSATVEQADGISALLLVEQSDDGDRASVLALPAVEHQVQVVRPFDGQLPRALGLQSGSELRLLAWDAHRDLPGRPVRGEPPGHASAEGQDHAAE